MTTPAEEVDRRDRFKETIERFITMTAEKSLEAEGIQVDPDRLALAVMRRLRAAFDGATGICVEAGLEAAMELGAPRRVQSNAEMIERLLRTEG